MSEHNKNFYSLKEVERCLEASKEFQDGEEIYYFIGALRYVYDENKRLNNIINELEKDIKKLYTYGIKNNAEQRDYLLNRLEELKEYKGSDKE